MTKISDIIAHSTIVDDRYIIYLDTGVVYDLMYAKDIPQYVFEIRDSLMQKYKDTGKYYD